MSEASPALLPGEQAGLGRRGPGPKTVIQRGFRQAACYPRTATAMEELSVYEVL